MINSITIHVNRNIRLCMLLLVLPFCHRINTPQHIKTSLNKTKNAEQLIKAYAFYITIATQYANTFKKIHSTSQHSGQWHKIMHEIVINSHNASENKEEVVLVYKENNAYQELPYLYFKKNLSSIKKKIKSILSSLKTKYTIEQSSIIHCFRHMLAQITLLEKAIIKMPEYYQEQIKIASKKEPLITQFLQSGIGLVVKKIIPFF